MVLGVEAFTYDIQRAMVAILTKKAVASIVNPPPRARLYDNTVQNQIGEAVAKRILCSNWFIVRKPTEPWHGLSYGPSSSDEGK